jgi:Predicted periplasmic protein
MHYLRLLHLCLIPASAFAIPALLSPEAAAQVVIRYGPGEKPMVFAVVRGRSEACEPTCPEWISAEGMITDDSPAALREVLDGIGDRNLPLILSSAGGSIDAAIEMGRMIRERGLGIVVGRTADWACAPADPDCRPQDGLYRAEAQPEGFCHSACTIMFAGGVERRAESQARLGVHMPYRMRTTEQKIYENRYKIVDGKKVRTKGKRLKKRIIRETMAPVSEEELETIAGYFVEMGVEPDIIDLFRSTPSSDMLILPDYEKHRFKLVTDRHGIEALAAPGRCTGDRPAPNCVTREGAEARP